MLDRKTELWIALVCLVAGLIAAILWVPFDSETPPIYDFRRQTYIGDAMLPMVAAAGIAICAAVHLILNWRRKPTDTEPPFDKLTGGFFLILFAIIISAFLVMYWAGPVALALFGPSGEEAVTYRQMRSTAPWKYLGFVLGGFILVFGITTLLEGQMKWKRAVSSLIAIIVLIVIFDVPFDTILLPPNGDF
jgi:uncharacterized membrane protein YidH (DUF202 family)